MFVGVGAIAQGLVHLRIIFAPEPRGQSLLAKRLPSCVTLQAVNEVFLIELVDSI
jgi:hypothetical protein